MSLQDEGGGGPPENMNPHEAAKNNAKEETMEARAKRIASQWIKDDSAEAPEPAAPQVPIRCSDRKAQPRFLAMWTQTRLQR